MIISDYLSDIYLVTNSGAKLKIDCPTISNRKCLAITAHMGNSCGLRIAFDGEQEFYHAQDEHWHEFKVFFNASTSNITNVVVEPVGSLECDWKVGNIRECSANEKRLLETREEEGVCSETNWSFVNIITNPTESNGMFLSDYFMSTRKNIFFVVGDEYMAPKIICYSEKPCQEINLSKNWLQSNFYLNDESPAIDNWKYLPYRKKAYLGSDNMYKNVSFSVKATSKVILKICSERSRTCSDVDLSINYYSAQKWKFFTVRTENKKLFLRDMSKNYEVSCAYNPQRQKLPDVNILRRPYKNYGITISNLNLTYKQVDDNIYVQSIRVLDGVLKVYHCKYIFVLLLQGLSKIFGFISKTQLKFHFLLFAIFVNCK